MEESRPSAHAVRDAELTEKIREVDQEQKHRYGIERILWELQEDGLRTSQRRVRRLARAAGVECVHPRPYVRTTLPDAQARDGLVDLVDRDFRLLAADQLWVGDITYLHTIFRKEMVERLPVNPSGDDSHPSLPWDTGCE